MNLFGIDLGIRKVSVSVFTEGDSGFTLYGVQRLVLPTQKREVELYKLATYVSHLALTHDPDYIFIEAPIVGNNRKYSMALAETKGAILGGLGQSKEQSSLNVMMVDNNTWKLAVVGNGHAGKDAVTNYINVTHPAYAAFCGDDQDAYDSCCIALYGIALLDKAQHLTL